jgi:hypothetical protein
MSSLNLIEKWIINDCNCKECIEKTKNLKRDISKIKIKRHPKSLQHNLLLTSKMIIKIQLEITKKNIEKVYNKIE